MSNASTTRTSEAHPGLAQHQYAPGIPSQSSIVNGALDAFDPQAPSPVAQYLEVTSFCNPQHQSPHSPISQDAGLAHQGTLKGNTQTRTEDETNEATVDRLMQNVTRVPQPPKNFEVKPITLKKAMPSFLIDEYRRVMVLRKGISYVPKHGWDPDTGLPMYAIPCFLSNGIGKFLGPQSIFYNSLKPVFPRLLIFVQKVSPIFLVLWIETKYPDGTDDLVTDPRLWKMYKECWAFLKSWTNQRGLSVNVMTYLERYTGDAATEAEAESLMPPADPKWV